jgi:hypothetical protein
VTSAARFTGSNAGFFASDHFAPVRVNESLTLLFDQDIAFDGHHFASHVSDDAFDAILSVSRSRGFHTVALLGASITAISMIGMAAEAFISRT